MQKLIQAKHANRKFIHTNINKLFPIKADNRKKPYR